MAKIFHTIEELDERGYNQRGYNQRGYDEEYMLEKAFKEGCEHGYHKAMKEMEGYHERSGRTDFKESFEEKIEKLKQKYK